MKASELVDKLLEGWSGGYGDDDMPDGYSNEYARASADARHQLDTNPDFEKIAGLIEAGRFVVVSKYPAYGPMDEVLAMVTNYHADFATREEADSVADAQVLRDGEQSEGEWDVLPRQPVKPVARDEEPDDGIPF